MKTMRLAFGLLFLSLSIFASEESKVAGIEQSVKDAIKEGSISKMSSGLRRLVDMESLKPEFLNEILVVDIMGLRDRDRKSDIALNMARSVVDYYVSPLAKSGYSDTALDIAVYARDLDMVNALLSSGYIGHRAYHTDPLVMSAVSHAPDDNLVDIVKVLAKKGYGKGSVDYAGRTPSQIYKVVLDGRARKMNFENGKLDKTQRNLQQIVDVLEGHGL